MTNIDAIFGTAPVEPHHAEAEACLLASLMANNDGYDEVADRLRPDHFYDGALGRIYEAIGDLIARGHKANPVTLKRAVPDDIDIVVEVAGALISVANNDQYCRIILNMWQRRELMHIGRDLVDEAGDGAVMDEVESIRQRVEGRLFDLAAGAASGGGAKSMADIMPDMLNLINDGITAQRAGKVTGTPVGISDLDRDLSGLQDGNLIILAGRPSMGKTALALSMAINAARDRQKPGGVAFFSLEMSTGQLMDRVFSNIADLDCMAIVRRVLSDHDFRRMAEFAEDFKREPLVISDVPGLSVAAMRTECRKISRQCGGLKLVVVDYLQLMAGSRNVKGGRYEQITEISMQLKRLAKELDVPVLALSQLSRSVEQRDDKRPLLSDLRESGSIEQDADVVMFVYREQYYLERTEPVQKQGESADRFGERYIQWQERMSICEGTADVIVAKARQGKVGTVRCAFLPHRMRFSDLNKAA